MMVEAVELEVVEGYGFGSKNLDITNYALMPIS